MFKRALLSTLSLAVGITLTTGVAASAQVDPAHQHNQTTLYAATLAGANEVPAADPADSARAIIRVTGTQVCFAENWSHLTGPTASHIHSAAAGVAGPVVVPLFAGAVPTSITAVTGCTTSDAATLAAIKANPAAFYVNIHTPLFPAGAARGQLHLLHGSSFDLRSALEGGNFLAIARSANESTPTVPNGTSVAFFRINTDSVRFAFTWQNIVEQPFAAHIHSGAAGTNGPVVVPFFAAATTAGLPPTINGVAGSVPGDPAVLAQIRKTPSQFYFNMHTATFPAGVVRGQLFRIG
ncbi:MAG TPA: CHRD domain-containing protein [Pseudonocardiaceae bacterium]|nr:CHRD domain-containing protein [Pseudonocardiaceae bacterium]